MNQPTPSTSWDLTKIFKTDDDFYKAFNELSKSVSTFSAHEKTMTKSAEELYRAICDLWHIEERLDKLWCYASLHFCLNTSDGVYQAMTGKVRSLAAKIEEVSWFFFPSILKISDKELARFFDELPALSRFRRLIDKTLRSRPFTLSDECEAFSAKLDDCFGTHGTVRNIFANSDLDHGKIKDASGKAVALTDANYITFMQSSDRKTRERAFRAMYKSSGTFRNTLAALYDAAVRERTTLARVRGHKSSLHASTYRDEVTPDIYNALIRSVHKGLPALYDYYALKREMLGVKRLHMYDLYTPLVGALDRAYPYEEAVSELLDTVAVFGEEYTDTLRAGLYERGWVDAYPAKGKRSGAFSSTGSPDTEPYILLNYTETFDDMSTLAHEAGHSMHSYFSRKYNEKHEASYTIFVAEVASTVNELLFAHKKLRESKSDEEKLYILNHLMETYKGTLFRQTMFAEFEKKMHALVEKGEVLTADTLSSAYRRLVLRYFGKDVVCDKPIDLEWSRIPHFYTSFYVYKYATCISAASAIVKRIEKEGAPYIKKYIDFLKCGDSRSPLESLLTADIDMTDPCLIDAAIEDFKSAVSEFRAIYNKTNK